MRRSIALSLVAGAALSMVIGAELTPRPDPGEQSRPKAAAAVTRAASVIRPRLLDPVILARPLFDAGRRPPAIAAAVGVTPTALPRLTGGRQITVAEGGRLDRWVVTAIASGTATLRGAGGTRVVDVAFGPPLTAEAVAAAKLAASWQAPRDEAALRLYAPRTAPRLRR